MSLEFLILIGVFVIMLEQIRRLRARAAQQKAELESLLNVVAGMHNDEVQAELDAFEAELTPANTSAPETVEVAAERV